MKKGVKVALVLAAAIGVAGVGMTVGGIAAGAVNEDTSGVGNNWLVRWLRDHSARMKTYTIETEEGDIFVSDSDENITWDYFGPEEQIYRIEVTAETADVIVRNVEETTLPGDLEDGTIPVGVWKDQNDSSSVESHVEDGVLYVNCTAGDYHSGDNWGTEIMICLPEEGISQLSVSSDLGNVDLTDNLRIGTLEADLGAGNLDSGDQVFINESAVVSCGSGDIDVQDLTCLGDMQVSLDLGNAYLGFQNLGGGLDMTMGSGNVQIELPGDETDYNYDLSTGTGTITCGDLDSDSSDWGYYGGSHAGSSGDHIFQSGIGASMQLTNNPGGSTITVRNGLGDIDLSFMD